MSNDTAIVRVFKLWAKISMMIVDGTRDATKVADVLQTILDSSVRQVQSVIQILRGRFNPSEFIGEGWSVIAEETDTRSIALTELDFSKVLHRTQLCSGESYITGEENLKRLKSSDYIRLDADIFFTLWENKHLIPDSWKEKVSGNTRFIYFDGTVLRRPNGDRCVLYLCWDEGSWNWSVLWLGHNRYANDLSAVLAS